MLRNKFGGYCISCRKFVPVNCGYLERKAGKAGGAWVIKCPKCSQQNTTVIKGRDGNE